MTGSSMGWLRRRVPGAEGRRERNPLSMLSQWKVFDNLRRSLVPPTLVGVAAAGMDRAGARGPLDRGRDRDPLRAGGRSRRFPISRASPSRRRCGSISPQSGSQCGGTSCRLLLALAFLPYEAWYLPRRDRPHDRQDADHATPFARMESVERRGPRARGARPYRPARVLSHDGDRAGHRARRLDWPCHSPTLRRCAIAGPILLLWAASPAIAWWISRPLARRSARLLLDQIRFLRKLARKTWAYFETLRRSRTTIGCRPTTCRSIRRSASRIARRRPTWAWRCSPI